MIRNLFNQAESTRTTSNVTSVLTTYNTTYSSGYSVNRYTSRATAYSTSFNTLKNTLLQGFTFWYTGPTFMTTHVTGGDGRITSYMYRKVTSQGTYRWTVQEGLTSVNTSYYTGWNTSAIEYNNVTRTTSHYTSRTTTFNTNFNPSWSTS